MGRMVRAWLSDDDAEAVRQVAEEDERTVGNLVKVAVLDLLDRRGRRRTKRDRDPSE